VGAFPGAQVTKTRPAVVLSTEDYHRYRPHSDLGHDARQNFALLPVGGQAHALEWSRHGQTEGNLQRASRRGRRRAPAKFEIVYCCASGTAPECEYEKHRSRFHQCLSSNARFYESAIRVLAQILWVHAEPPNPRLLAIAPALLSRARGHPKRKAEEQNCLLSRSHASLFLCREWLIGLQC